MKQNEIGLLKESKETLTAIFTRYETEKKWFERRTSK